MAKQAKGKEKASRRRKKTRTWQGVVALIVLGGLASAYVLVNREPSSGAEAASEGMAQTEGFSSSPTLRNRLVLPATPRSPRPIILNPASFPEPEVQQAYQVAKAIPEVLEQIACYCGCYGSSGHRNNLDCFKDNHGAT